ncbi:hypothetical protein ACF09K_33540 [Streptomyces sp. NPDC014882]|uniref:hypothetical protein n=1 Tax=Streptomyces sp. NPDC014882 TaxID=3364927 RepID=UPI0037032A4D
MGGKHPVVQVLIRSSDPQPGPQPLGEREVDRGVHRDEVEDHAGQERAHLKHQAQENSPVQNADLIQVNESLPRLPDGRRDDTA